MALAGIQSNSDNVNAVLTAPQGHKTVRMKENKMHFDEMFGKLND